MTARGLEFVRESDAKFCASTGHASWRLHGERAPDTLGDTLLALGWGEEWELVTFLQKHAGEIAPWLAGGGRAAATHARERLGKAQIDLLLGLEDGAQVAIEVKGPAMSPKDQPGVQALEYAAGAKGQRFAALVAAAGIGEKRAGTLPTALDPRSWWPSSRRASDGRRLITLFCVRAAPDRIVLSAFDDLREARAFLEPRAFDDPHRKRLADWAQRLGVPPPSKAARNAHKVDLGRTDGRRHVLSAPMWPAASDRLRPWKAPSKSRKEPTEVRWALRIHEDFTWLVYQSAPPPVLDGATPCPPWLHMGGGGNYPSRRLLLGPRTEEFDPVAARAAHLPAGIKPKPKPKPKRVRSAR